MGDLGNQNFDRAQPQPAQRAPDAGATLANGSTQPAAQSAASQAKRAPADNAIQPIGVVLEIAGSGSQIALDIERLNECMADEDPSVALAGQVGSQVKIRWRRSASGQM